MHSAAGLCPNPLGIYSAPQTPSWIKGTKGLRGIEERGGEGKGRTKGE